VSFRKSWTPKEDHDWLEERGWVRHSLGFLGVYIWEDPITGRRFSRFKAMEIQGIRDRVVFEVMES